MGKIVAIVSVLAIASMNLLAVPPILSANAEDERVIASERLGRIIISSFEAQGMNGISIITHLQHSIARSGSDVKLIVPEYISLQLRKVNISMTAHGKSLLQIIDAVCMVAKLKFTLKGSEVIFDNDSAFRSFSQTSSGNKEVDAALAAIRIPRIDIVDFRVQGVIRYIDRSYFAKNSHFLIVVTEEGWGDTTTITLQQKDTNALKVIQEICKQGNVKFAVFNDVIFFQAKFDAI